MLAAVAGPSPGMMLGKYQVLRHLATGGMAEIFLARTIGLERFERYVVVKCIKPEFAANTQFVDMFLDEARISAQLHHHHIAQVFDIGLEGGVLYFAMEYVHGQNVQAILQAVSIVGGFVPLEHALSITIGAAQGLGYAHDKLGPDGMPLELVHRDVTPTNILVSYDGAVKVVDFGIVKAATRSTHTRSGVMKGKIAYMSPEQCHSAPLDRRSDVFALGILLYELTTSRRLFETESDYGTMNRIVTGDVPHPSTYRSDYPDELAEIVIRCLDVDPARRYQTADALAEDLIGFAQRAMLTPTNVGLARYMREVFGKPPEPWIGLAVPPLDLAPTAPALPSSGVGGVGGGSGAGVPDSGVLVKAAPPVAPSEVLPAPRSKRWAIVTAVVVVAIGVGAAMWIGTRNGDVVPAAAPATAPATVKMVPEPVTPNVDPSSAGSSATSTSAAGPTTTNDAVPTTTNDAAPTTKNDAAPTTTTTTATKPSPARSRTDKKREAGRKHVAPREGSGSGSAAEKLRDATILTPPD